MPTPPLSDALAVEALEAWQRHRRSHKLAAAELGIPERTFQNRLGIAKARGLENGQALRSQAAASRLRSHGYEVNTQHRTDAEAWDAHSATLEYKLGQQAARVGRTLTRSGPFAIYHSTDQHVDDDASALWVLQDDIAASHEMGAIMCHGGDLLNNWPLGGKLAKQWADQSCTMPDALRRARHFVEMFKPDVWVDGNHEEMNPYLVNLFDEWLPGGVIRDYWRVDFSVEVPGGRTIRCALSHKFQKGGSWFHGLHGHIREMLQSEERDLYMDGHFHQAAQMVHTLPERGHTAVLVASAGYKLIDRYATRISRGGKVPTLPGRAHWIVCDPFSEDQFLTVFRCPAGAAAFLETLQNIREV